VPLDHLLNVQPPALTPTLWVGVKPSLDQYHRTCMVSLSGVGEGDLSGDTWLPIKAGQWPEVWCDSELSPPSVSVAYYC
jgi:hypothetical protein